MTVGKVSIGLVIGCLLALPAAAESGAESMPGVFRYDTRVNHCPSGLQPVVYDGLISCGKPNRSESFQQVMRHPVQKRTAGVQRRARVACPIGETGCS